jgi:hypothetical protein
VNFLLPPREFGEGWGGVKKLRLLQGLLYLSRIFRNWLLSPYKLSAQKVGKADLDKAASIIATILSHSKLQKKWKHAVDLGVTTPWKASDRATHTKFQAALNDVVANADVVFVGSYHGSNWIAHFFKGDKLVITELSKDFISGWANASNKLAGIKTAAPPLGSNNFRVR